MNNDIPIYKKIKNIIKTNGHKYLELHPYEVYLELLKVKDCDKSFVSALLCTMANGTISSVRYNNNKKEVIQIIKRDCGFNEIMSKRLADLFLNIYSKENEEEWKELENKGPKEFLEEEINFEWKGLSEWDYSSGFVSCHYNANIVIKTRKSFRFDKEIKQAIANNPFLKKEEIEEHYMNKCIEELNRKFEYYCTCDKYYQPCVEDFELESYLKDWCNKNRFTLVFCDGEGYDDGYEPNF